MEIVIQRALGKVPREIRPAVYDERAKRHCEERLVLFTNTLKKLQIRESIETETIIWWR